MKLLTMRPSRPAKTDLRGKHAFEKSNAPMIVATPNGMAMPRSLGRMSKDKVPAENPRSQTLGKMNLKMNVRQLLRRIGPWSIILVSYRWEIVEDFGAGPPARSPGRQPRAHRVGTRRRRAPLSLGSRRSRRLEEHRD